MRKLNQKAEGMMNAILIIIAFIVIIAVAGSAVYTTQQEISTLNEEIENINNDLEIVSNSIENNKNQNKLCIKYLTKGFNEYYEAGINKGYADAHYDAASEMYELDSFAWGTWYADYADTYYGFANSTYRGAKAFFTEALDYTEDEDMIYFIQTLIDLSEIDSQLASELHEANEYFSSACTYFDNGDYYTGNAEIDTMNEHIENHDDMIFEQNDLWAEIEVCLEKLS